MEKREKDKTRIFYLITILTMLLAAYFLRKYFSLIGVAFLTVIVFNPLYRKLTRLFKGNKGISTPLVILSVYTSLVIPIIFISSISFMQVNKVISDIKDSTTLTDESGFSKQIDNTIDKVNASLDPFPYLSEQDISKEQVNRSITDYTKKLGSFALSFLGRLGGNAANFTTGLIVYTILLASIFPNQKRIKNSLTRLRPLDDRIDSIYISRMVSMARSMVKGTFVIAIVQGLLGGLFLWISGVPYTFFFIILLTFLSIIPLGGGILTLPIGVVLLALGNFWEGLFIILTHIFVITNVDNLLRPKLVSEDVRLPSVLTLLAVFAGIDLFGWLGIIYGPMLMIFIVTTIQIYDKYYNPNSHSKKLKESDPLDIGIIE